MNSFYTGLRNRFQKSNNNPSSTKNAKKIQVQAQVLSAFENVEKVGRNITETPKETAEKEMTVFCLTLHAMLSADFTRRLLNERAQWWRISLTTVGIVCLVCPILVIIDRMVEVFVPEEMLEAVALLASYPIHERSLHGELNEDTFKSVQTARICMKALSLAKRVSEANRSKNGAYLAVCLGALTLLLFVLRLTARRRQVMTAVERQEIIEVAEAIHAELRRRCLGDTSERRSK